MEPVVADHSIDDLGRHRQVAVGIEVDRLGDEVRVVRDGQEGVSVQHALQQRGSGARTAHDEHVRVHIALSPADC
jgi:hypothetical protein